MNPTIQLIQLTVKFERQEKARRRTFKTQRDGLTIKTFGYMQKLNNRIQQIFNPPRHQHCCECA